MANIPGSNSLLSGPLAGLQAMGTLAGGIAGMNASNYNADILRQNAGIAMTNGAMAVQNSDFQFRAAEGRQLAAQGGSGFQAGTGSMLDAVAQSRVEQTFSALNIMRNAQVRAAGFNEEADMASAAGTNRLLASGIGATSGLLKIDLDYANSSNSYGYNPLSAGGAMQPTPQIVGTPAEVFGNG